LSPTFCRNSQEMSFATVLLDRHSECWSIRQLLWLVNADSTAARTRGIGGYTFFSRTDSVFVRARDVSTAPMPKHLSLAWRASRSRLVNIESLVVLSGD